MMMTYWFMFPVAIVISTIAMASGIGGATFFSPFFMLVLGLSPEVAIGTGLITEVFGFASGLAAYIKKGLIDFKVGLSLVIITVPMAILGSIGAGMVAPEILKVILGVGLFAVATSFLKTPDKNEVNHFDFRIEEEYGGTKAETCLTTSANEKICYTVCNKSEGRIISGIGGLFVGLISTGLGELNEFFLLKRCRVPSRVSVATSVFIVAITALSASIGHLSRFIQSGEDELQTILNIVVFTVPGVMIGAQFGSGIASKIPEKILLRGLAVLFFFIALVTLLEVAL